jgi:hypothetical protein
VLLDRGQAADGRDDVRGRGDVQLRTGQRSCALVDRRQRGEVEAERHNRVLLRPADAVVGQQLVPDTRRDRDNAIGRARQTALDRQEQPRFRRAEVSLEHVAVIRVHHACGTVASGGAIVNRRRHAAERAGLGHVRVDDVRPEIAHDVEQLCQRDGVQNRRGQPQRRRYFTATAGGR